MTIPLMLVGMAVVMAFEEVRVEFVSNYDDDAFEFGEVAWYGGLGLGLLASGWTTFVVGGAVLEEWSAWRRDVERLKRERRNPRPPSSF